MGFSKTLIAKALEEKRLLRQSNEKLREDKKSLLYYDYPRVREIDKELSSLGLQIAMLTFSGDKQKLEEVKERCLSLQAEKKELYDESKYTVDFSCKKCEDTGYVGGKYCDCVLKAAKKLQFQELSSIMPFNECSFSNFRMEYYPTESIDGKPSPRLRMDKNINCIARFISSFPSGENLLFIGGVGLGKTHVSVSIAREIVDKGYGVFYASVEDLITNMQKEKFGKLGGEYNYTDAINEVDLLIIDDLGTEFNTQYSRTAIYEIVNSRILSGKSTIINTNLFMEELSERYTPRIASRFIGNYTSLLFDGVDIRQQKAMENK